MEFRQRTDLALEAGELAGEIDGVVRSEKGGCQIMVITTEDAAKAVGKPVGRYCTLTLEAVLHREDGAFEESVRTLADEIRTLLPQEGCVLCACLGNRDVTPDALGALAAKNILVTRHLKYHLPEEFKGFRSTAVITPGVLGTSGVESASYVKAVCDFVRPSAIIAIDALASRRTARLCRTVQISNTGITPGSGVGNSRDELSEAVLGVPVIALGVPTVVDVATLLFDTFGETTEQNAASKDIAPPAESDALTAARHLFVTPRSIDSDVACAGRLLGYAVNLALHEGLSLGDIDMLLG